MMDLQWVFGGIGAVVVGAIATALMTKASRKVTQIQHAGGERSTNIQATGDIHVHNEQLTSHKPEERAREREGEATRLRIAAALVAEARALRRVFIHGQFTLEEWQSLHDALNTFVDSDAAARALGSDYLTFMSYLSYDQRSINLQVSHAATWSEPTSYSERSAAYERAVHDAQTKQNVASVLLQLVPLLRSLDVNEADEYEHSATSQMATCGRILSSPPPTA